MYLCGVSVGVIAERGSQLALGECCRSAPHRHVRVCTVCCLQLNRFLRDDMSMPGVRFALRDSYKLLINMHRQYSAGGAISDAFNMQVTEFSHIVKALGLVGDGFQLSEIDTIFIASNVDMNKKKLNPERSLVRLVGRSRVNNACHWSALTVSLAVGGWLLWQCRYEFIEAMVRVAHAKFVKSEHRLTACLRLAEHG